MKCVKCGVNRVSKYYSEYCKPCSTKEKEIKDKLFKSRAEREEKNLIGLTAARPVKIIV